MNNPSTTTGNVKEKAQHLKEVPFVDKISETFDSVGPAVQDAYRAAEETVKHSLDTTAGTIKKYPVQSLLVGFGVGCLVGMILRRGE